MSNLALTQQKELNVSTVKKYLVSGNGNVTEQECVMFIALCKYQKLNPFLREAYLIKFGSSPATMVVGKEVFTKRASRIGDCAGWEAGIIVQDTNCKILKKHGVCVLPQEILLGGWARIHRHNWKVAFEHEVSLSEYARKKSDGTLQSNWRDMPATMIRKVALVQALRDTFPEDFQGLYDSTEMPTEDIQLQESPINIPDIKTENAVKQNFDNFEHLESSYLISEEENKVNECITEKQRKRLFAIVQGKTEQLTQVCEPFGYKSTKDILTKDYSKICEMLESNNKEG
jgi:phage recombination protein Bet